MKILSVNQGYNNKAQKTNQAKGNTNFGAVLVKSNFELFEGRKSLAEKLLAISWNIPSKLTALANWTRGNSENIVAKPYTWEAENPTRLQEVYLSDAQERKLDYALLNAGRAIEHNQDGKEWGEIQHYGLVTDKLWEQSRGPVRELRDLAEEFFAEAEKNPIEHVITACAAKLAKANEKVGDAQHEISSDLHSALNGKKFPVPPEQLWLPTMKPKVRKSIKNGLGVEIVSWEE